MMRGRFAPPSRAGFGQLLPPQTQQLSFCGIVTPVLSVPGVKEVVQKIGCNPAMRGALAAAIIQNYTQQTGSSAAAAPWYTQILAVAGVEVVADCACQNKSFMPTQPPPGGFPGAASLSSPLVLAVLAAGVIGLVMYSRRAPARQIIVTQAAPPALPAAPAAPAAPPAAATTPPKSTKPAPRASQRRHRRRSR